MNNLSYNKYRICVIGLGYVGLPLARLFSSKYTTIGYDTNSSRIEEINKGEDTTNNIDSSLLNEAILKGFFATNNTDDIKDCNVYIITVPTPINANNSPDLSFINSATKTIAKIIKKGDYVIYESTIYPGATENHCVPIIEKESKSKLKCNIDFFIGYSPERINPGDKKRTVENINKIVSGGTADSAKIINELYKSVIKAGTYLAPSIKVAEAAKIIENSQRDINIAFINEVAMIFAKMGIDTADVIAAASTKWNFMKLIPGLVGGHCISVDPYYLIDASNNIGFSPTLMTQARQINNDMPNFVSNEIIKIMNLKGNLVKDAKILFLGYSFKANCGDIRNTKTKDLIQKFEIFTDNIDVFDPHVEKIDYNVNRVFALDTQKKYDCIILTVEHNEFIDFNFRELLTEKGILYDIKSILPKEMIDGRL